MIYSITNLSLSTVCYGQLPVTCTVHCTIPKKKKHQDLQYKKRGNSIGKAQRR